MTKTFSAATLVSLALHAGAATPNPQSLLTDPAAMAQLVSAVSLDVMTEASLEACADMGASSTEQARAAWAAWRERHQIAPLRMVLISLKQRDSSSIPPWSRLTEPMRQRVLRDAAPDRICAALGQDLQGADMDVSALFPQARPVAQGLLQLKMAYKPTTLNIAPGAPRGQLLLPSQIPALVKQHGRWSAIGDEAAHKRLGLVYVKGRVERHGMDGDRYRLVQQQGERRSAHTIALDASAEPWVGREVVLRGLFTSLDTAYANLASASVVSDVSGLAPSPLPQEPLERQEVLLQRVSTAAGKGLADRDLAAIVLHGEASVVNGANWDEDVRFLLRDGTAYRRSGMPPDQLNVSASRQLEPQQWGRWRGSSGRYEMQGQDDEGRPDGGWKPEKHEAVKPWPAGTRLDGAFSRGRATGSVITGGTTSTQGIRFTRDGRFERSYSATSSTGTLAAIMNNTVIAGSSYGDGKGSSATGGGSVGTAFGSAGAVSSNKKDDGASRRGRYQLGGFVLTLDYDDGHQERLLSFPVSGDAKSVYVGDGSYSLDK